MKTVFVCNAENEWLRHGAIHHGYENIPDFDPVICYTPKDISRWSEVVGKFMAGLGEPYVLLMLDDYWVQEVDAELLDMAETAIKISNASKVDVSGDRLQFPHETISPYLVASYTDARYRTSLQAAIWRTEYLLNFCRTGWSPWDFEIKGSQVAMNDGALILGTTKPAVRYINVLRRGKWYGKFDF